MTCYILHHTHSKFCHIQISVYSGIFKRIQPYSALLRHIDARSIIEEYSSLFRHIQNPVQPSRVHNLAIFRSLAYLKPEAYSKPWETLTKYIQNPAIVRTIYSCIIQPYSGIFKTLCNRCICRNLAYLESWYI